MTVPYPLLTDEVAPAEALDAFFAGFFRHQPVTATFAGVHDHDHRLPDWSPDGLAAAARDRRALRMLLNAARLGRLPGWALARRDWDVIDGALVAAWLEIEEAEDASAHYVRGNPSLAVGEALFGLVSLAWDVHRPVAVRAEAARWRAAATASFLEGARLTIGDRPVPAAWKERAVRECEAGADLMEDLSGWLATERAPDGVRRDFARAAASATLALREYAAWLSGRPDASPVRYGAGEELLQLLIRRGHWCESGLDSLVHEARAAMADERHRLDALLKDSGLSGWPEAAERLSRDNAGAADVLASCRRTWQEVRDASKDQVTWPGLDVRYEPMPAWARRAAPRLYYLMYRSPAPLRYPSFDRYAVPVPLPDESPEAELAFSRAWNRSAVTLNHVAHHGGPGHHVQNWHASRSPSRVGRIAAVDGASRMVSLIGGTMAEGWACYATELLGDAGFLSPDERLAVQHTRVRLAVRAVVDLELHAGRLTFDGAVAVHERFAGVSPAAARAEVTKCSMFPGSACMYWLGLRELHRIRAQAEQAAGAAFDRKGFHDSVLSCGSIPVTLAAAIVRAAGPS